MSRIIHGDCLEVLRTLPAGSVHCCITSPPYYGLRDYAEADQIGQEETPEEYIERLVSRLREVKRVLRDDGTLWLNLGDSYADQKTPNLEAKQLIGIPWKVAFALQADGWYLRQDIIWAKPNPMPGSMIDRCTTAHEYLFLLTKQPRYFFDSHAIREPAVCGSRGSHFHTGKTGEHQQGRASKKRDTSEEVAETRIKRDVWTVSVARYKGAHFATFPAKLIEPCVLAGSSSHGCCSGCGAPWTPVYRKDRFATRPGANTKVTGNNKVEGNRDPQRHVTQYELDRWEPTCKCAKVDGLPLDRVPAVVLDPFNGSGTTGAVAIQHGRDYIGIELNAEYIELANKRLAEAAIPVRNSKRRTLASAIATQKLLF